MVGRFELRRMIGEGGQAAVWLGFDPMLEREVAIKVMRRQRGDVDPAVASQWLQEARHVSRLAHPNVIPVFEADIQDEQAYLVFEYVPGPTLAALIKQRGALPAREAVGLMCDVLQALVAAHAIGIVHRDLKPSNILVDASGRARVMDFGIAARMQEGDTAESEVPIAGTPGYISPEAARGAKPAPTMDVFSAAIVLAEMLSGQRLITDKDPMRAIQRVIGTQLSLPEEVGSRVDDGLRSIVQRGLMRDPAQRYPQASLFLDALRQWLAPPGIEVAQSEENGGGTLEFLLRRMRHKSDFPAMSSSIMRIQSISSSDKESVATLTNEILKDVALTNKLLRMVNTAFYARGGPVGTVSRAVTLVGFNAIRSMALSLVLLEHMGDKAHANDLKEEFLRSLMAGTIARELSPGAREAEEAFLGAMFQNLGRLLAEYYFPEEARAVRELTGGKDAVSEPAASATILGTSYEALGQGIAKAWNLPESLQRCIQKPVGGPPKSRPLAAVDQMRLSAMAANEMADVLLRTEPAGAAAKLEQIGRSYMASLGLGAGAIASATQRAREKLADLAHAMNIRVAPESAAARLLKSPQHSAQASSADADGFAEFETANLEQATLPPGGAGIADAQEGASAQASAADMLAAGIQDITNAMVDDFKLSDVLRMILETMWRAIGFRRIVFCLRDPKTGIVSGRFGMGHGADKAFKSFRIDLKSSTPDLFTVVCSKGADTLISDATDQRIATRLPSWYVKTIHAPSFLLLPLMNKQTPLGLIYADKGEAGSLQLGEKELALLRTLRNQAVMAFRQSS